MSASLPLGLQSRGGIAIGDVIDVAYYQSENEDGREVERNTQFKVAGIVPLTEPDRPFRRDRPAVFEASPTVFNDPNMTPSVAGITDQDSISEWETPFPLTRTINKADDEYWNNHRLTPKLYITLQKAQQLFGARFGNVSSIRMSTDIANTTEELQGKIAKALQRVAPELGLASSAHSGSAASGCSGDDTL